MGISILGRSGESFVPATVEAGLVVDSQVEGEGYGFPLSASAQLQLSSPVELENPSSVTLQETFVIDTDVDLDDNGIVSTVTSSLVLDTDLVSVTSATMVDVPISLVSVVDAETVNPVDVSACLHLDAGVDGGVSLSISAEPALLLACSVSLVACGDGDAVCGFGLECQLYGSVSRGASISGNLNLEGELSMLSGGTCEIKHHDVSRWS